MKNKPQYIKLSNNKIKKTKEIFPEVFVDYDVDDMPTGIEILNRKNIPKVFTLQECAKIFNINQNTFYGYVQRNKVTIPLSSLNTYTYRRNSGLLYYSLQGIKKIYFEINNMKKINKNYLKSNKR